MVHQVLLDLLDLYLDGFPSRNEVYRFNINLYLKSKTSIPISPDVQRARYDFAAGIQGSVFPNCLQPANAQMVDKFWRVVRNYNTMLNDQGIWKGNQVNDTVFEFGTENLLQSPRTTNSNGTGRDPSRLIQELEEAKKNIARLVNDNEQLATSLTKSVEDSDVVTATLRKKLQEKEKALVELTRRITELETESAKKIAAAYSSTRKCSDRMNNEPATSLQTNLKIKMDGIAKETMEKKLQKTLDDFKIKTLQTQIGSLKAETWKERALKPNNTGQNETTSILQKTLGGKDQSFKELTDKIADMTKQLVDSAGTVQNLTQKVNKLEEKKQISNLLAVDLKSRLKRKDVDIACLQNCLKVKEQSLLELNNQITEFYAENEKRIVELIALRAKYGSLGKVLTVRNELVTSLQAKVDGLTAGLRATQDTQKAGDDAQISTFETKIRNLEAELEKERASEQILTTKTEHALIVKTQIQMITSLQKTVEDKNQSLKELSDSLTSLTSESDSYSQMIKDKQTVIDSLKAKYLEIERRLKADQKKMIKIGEKEQQLNELRQSSKLKINSLQQRIRGLEAELAATTKQNPPSHSDTPFTAEMSKKLLSELLDTYYAVGIPSRNDVYQFNITLYQKTNTPYPISPGVWKARNVFANAIKMSELPVWIPRYTAPYNKFYRVAEKYKKATECADSKKRKHPHNDTLFEFGTSSPSESVKAKKKMNEETKNHIKDQMQQMKTELEKAETLLNEEKSKNEKLTETIAKFKYAFERKALYGTSLEKRVEEAEKALDSERRRVQELVDKLKEIQARCTKLDEDKSQMEAAHREEMEEEVSHWKEKYSIQKQTNQEQQREMERLRREQEQTRRNLQVQTTSALSEEASQAKEKYRIQKQMTEGKQLEIEKLQKELQACVETRNTESEHFRMLAAEKIRALENEKSALSEETAQAKEKYNIQKQRTVDKQLEIEKLQKELLVCVEIRQTESEHYRKEIGAAAGKILALEADLNRQREEKDLLCGALKDKERRMELELEVESFRRNAQTSTPDSSLASDTPSVIKKEEELDSRPSTSRLSCPQTILRSFSKKDEKCIYLD